MDLSKFRLFDPTLDYTSLLKTNEIKEEDGRQFVYLRGLERLAKERGIANAICTRLDQVVGGGMIATYQYGFVDGCIYQGSADATKANCEGNFGGFLTAMAESRAKARALRTAFGISMCSVEEKADIVVMEDTDNAAIEDHQLQAIKFLAKQKEFGKDEVLAFLSRSRPIGDMRELTKEEGRELIKALNDNKKAKAEAKVKTARR